VRDGDTGTGGSGGAGPRTIFRVGSVTKVFAFDPDRGLGVAAPANSAGPVPSPLDAAVMAAFG
jgi:hypothetical protein